MKILKCFKILENVSKICREIFNDFLFWTINFYTKKLKVVYENNFFSWINILKPSYLKHFSTNHFKIDFFDLIFLIRHLQTWNVNNFYIENLKLYCIIENFFNKWGTNLQLPEIIINVAFLAGIKKKIFVMSSITWSDRINFRSRNLWDCWIKINNLEL